MASEEVLCVQLFCNVKRAVQPASVHLNSAYMLEFMKRFDMSKYQGTKMRTPGYMSEVLYGIFIYWVLKQRKYKVEGKSACILQRNQCRKVQGYSCKNSGYSQKAQKRQKRFKEDNEKHLPCISCCSETRKDSAHWLLLVKYSRKSQEHSVLLARTVKVCQSTAPKSVQAAAG